MKKYFYFFLAVLLVVSITFNLSLNTKLNVANNKITEINENTALIVERNIRQSIVNTKELIDTNSKEALFGLQRTVEDLAVSLMQWYQLNQTEELTSSTIQKGLNGIEAIRSTIIHHLNRQYILNGDQLQVEDIEMLERFSENMNRLLLVYHNILNSKNPFSADSGLWQIANNFEEMSRLYRHSSIPNKHPEYISFEKAVNSIGEQLTELKDYDIKVDSKNVFVKEGVHYYQFNLEKENELVYTVAIDARSGAIRNLEYKKAIDGNKLLSSYETLNIATNFLKKYYIGDFQTEMLYIKNDNDNTSLYSFRFIPIEDNIKILSDAYIVNVCPQSGRILKYSNDYNNTKVVSTEQYFSQQEILTKNPSDLGVLTYEGLTLVRSFRTRFRPTLTHSFRTTQKDQQLILYYDVRTGVLVHQLYHLYEQMQL